MKGRNLWTGWCPVVAVTAALILLVPSDAESNHALSCPEFGASQWALVSIVDDEGFALHESDPLHEEVPVEVQLAVAIGAEDLEKTSVFLCMEEDSWSTGVASCGVPLTGVNP